MSLALLVKDLNANDTQKTRKERFPHPLLQAGNEKLTTQSKS